MITKIKMPMVDGRRVLKVNNKETVGSGSSTWFINQRRETDNPVDILFRHIDYMKSYGMNLTRVWRWNDSLYGGKVSSSSRHSFTVEPKSETPGAYERTAYVVQTYLENDIIPIVILFRAREGANSREDWTFGQRDKDLIKDMVKALKGKPLIWDMMNEMPEGAVSFVKKAISYLKSQDTEKKPININTGFGSGGVSEKRLIDICKSTGAHSYAVLDGSAPVEKSLVALGDPDHSRLALNTYDPDDRLEFFNSCENRGCQMYLNMEGWSESWFRTTRGSSDVDNPSFPPAREWLGSIATSPWVKEEDPPTDPVDPPVEPPKDDDKGGCLGILSVLVAVGGSLTLALAFYFVGGIW